MQFSTDTKVYKTKLWEASESLGFFYSDEGIAESIDASLLLCSVVSSHPPKGLHVSWSGQG